MEGKAKYFGIVRKNAGLRGELAAGFKILRGSGNLKLTRKELTFKRYLIGKVIQIPMKSVTGVQLGLQHAGSLGWHILQVHFVDAGVEKIAGFGTITRKTAEKWKERIEDLIQKYF